MAIEIIETGAPSAAPDAVVVTAGARLLHLSGVGPAARGDDRVDGDAAAQAAATAAGLDARLAAAGAHWGDIVKIIEYVTDLRAVGALRDALAARGGADWRPARTLVQVDNLSAPGARWELDVVVALPA